VLASVIDRVRAEHGLEPNATLVNYYSGRDRIGWHADDEPTLASTTIVSLSLGEGRWFDVRPKGRTAAIRIKSGGEHLRGRLEDGDLIVMSGAMQARYKHRVPHARGDVGTRLNITFRQYR